ncbi:hypothetical protein ACFYO0_45845 [Streptomyces sp. NPDC006365]|uniref:hypothetical protein n=1 Tax=Streptomyces sp. NPDC006365 TaxID=3364744 RepID=UPI003682D7A6
MNTTGWATSWPTSSPPPDTHATSVERRADWADYGKDHFAAVAWENTPGGKRYTTGWMNNWDYSGAIPTSPWCGAYSAPRQMALRTIDGRIRLTSKPVNSLTPLRQNRPATAAGITVTDQILPDPSSQGVGYSPRTAR